MGSIQHQHIAFAYVHDNGDIKLRNKKIGKLPEGVDTDEEIVEVVLGFLKHHKVTGAYEILSDRNGASYQEGILK